jgi:multidrug efflux pump subunit AcrB
MTGALARKAALSLVLIAVVGVGGGGLAGLIPGGFVPIEDQGIMLANVQLPRAASLERTREVAAKVEQILRARPGVESFNVIGGMSFLSGTFAPNAASFFIRLKPWAERTTPETGLRGIVMGLAGACAPSRKRSPSRSCPPPCPASAPRAASTCCCRTAAATCPWPSWARSCAPSWPPAGKRPELAQLFTAFDPGVPQVALEVDREKARTLGVPIPTCSPRCRPRWAAPT